MTAQETKIFNFGKRFFEHAIDFLNTEIAKPLFSIECDVAKTNAGHIGFTD